MTRREREEDGMGDDERDVTIWIAGYRAACRELGETMREHAAELRVPPAATRSTLAGMTAEVGAAAAEGCARLTDGYVNTTGTCGSPVWPDLVRRAHESIADVTDGPCQRLTTAERERAAADALASDVDGVCQELDEHVPDGCAGPDGNARSYACDDCRRARSLRRSLAAYRAARGTP